MARKWATVYVMVLCLLDTAISRTVRIGIIQRSCETCSQVEAAEVAARVFENNTYEPNLKVEILVGEGANGDIGSAMDSFAEQLKVGGLVGVISSNSATSKVLGYTAAAHNLPMLCPTATADDLVNPQEYPTTRILQPPDSAQGEAMVAFFRHISVTSGLAVLYESTIGEEFEGTTRIQGCSYSANLARSFTTYAAKANIQVDAIYPVTNRTTAGDLSILRSKAIQFVVLLSTRSVGWAVLKAARTTFAGERAFGKGKLWMVSETIAGDTTTVPHGDLDGLLGVVPYSRNKKLTMKGAKLICELGSTTPDLYSKLTADAVYALLLAANNTGAFENTYQSDLYHKPSNTTWKMGDAMMQEIGELEFEGFTGNVNFSGDRSFQLMSLQDGEWSAKGSYTDRVRWDTQGMVWPGGATSYPERKGLLRGRKLRVLFVLDGRGIPVALAKDTNDSVVTDAASTWCKKDQDLCGVIPEIVNMLKEELGFEYDYDHQVGRYNDAIGLAENGTYDLVCGTFVITHERTNRVDFTERYLDTTFRLFVKPQQKLRSIWAFLDPFKNEVWVAIAGVVVASWLMFWVLERGYNDYVERGVHGFITSLWWSVTGFVCGQDGSPTSNGGRLIAIGVAIVSLLVISAYTANLVVFLQKRSLLYPVKSINDFNCIDTDEDTAKGDIPIRKLAVENNTQYAVWVSRACGRPNAPILDSGTKTFEHVLNGTALATIYLSVYQSFLRQITDCRLRYAPVSQVGEVLGLGFAMPKGSAYGSTLSASILRMREEGRVQSLVKEFLSGTCDDTEEDVSEDTPLQLREFGGVFIVYLVLMVSAIIVRLLRVFVLPCMPARCKRALRIDDSMPEGSAEEVLSSKGRFCSNVRDKRKAKREAKRRAAEQKASTSEVGEELQDNPLSNDTKKQECHVELAMTAEANAPSDWTDGPPTPPVTPLKPYKGSTANLRASGVKWVNDGSDSDNAPEDGIPAHGSHIDPWGQKSSGLHTSLRAPF